MKEIKREVNWLLNYNGLEYELYWMLWSILGDELRFELVDELSNELRNQLSNALRNNL